MGVRKFRSESGQMTIELAVAFPILIIVAIIATNAISFFGICAVFDRVASESVRAHASSPAYRQGPDQSCALVEQALRDAIDQHNVEIAVSHAATGLDLDQYTSTITFHPTLFGMGLRSEVFGVPLPSLRHSSTYVVDSYKPGVII